MRKHSVTASNFEASIEEAYERGVKAGRDDAIPPGVIAMPWCEHHNSLYLKGAFRCVAAGWARLDGLSCRREAKVTHWVTE